MFLEYAVSLLDDGRNIFIFIGDNPKLKTSALTLLLLITYLLISRKPKQQHAGHRVMMSPTPVKFQKLSSSNT